MPTTLHMATLSPSETSTMRQFESWVRKQYGMSLATYLLLELEEGRATVLDKKSPEYRSMTRWQ